MNWAKKSEESMMETTEDKRRATERAEEIEKSDGEPGVRGLRFSRVLVSWWGGIVVRGRL